jgi:hypothetical protein
LIFLNKSNLNYWSFGYKKMDEKMIFLLLSLILGRIQG